MISPLGTVVSPPVRPDGLEAHESHASASMLGQFRTSAAASIYLRADLYLHNGVEMRPLSSEEIKRGRHGVGGSKEEQALHNDGGIVTVVPAKKDDFRGILGDLERAGSTYMQMENHTHNDPKLSLPLFRLMTWVDSKFIPGWTMGAAIMIRDRTEESTSKAITFLENGLKDNPENIEILVQLGYTLAVCRKDVFGGLTKFVQARDAALGKTRLSLAESEALQECYHWLIIGNKEVNNPFAARRYAEEGRHMFPDDELLKRN